MGNLCCAGKKKKSKNEVEDKKDEKEENAAPAGNQDAEQEGRPSVANTEKTFVSVDNT